MMKLPAIRGVIDRRMLVNFRVDAHVATGLLPAPFRPKLANGYAIAGICLIRLKHLRPAFLPASVGVGSENAAHRFAVEWEREGQVCEGVFIPRRDSSSRFSVLAGGRLFPGLYHHARFEVSEKDDRLELSMASDDGATRVNVTAQVTDRLPAGSVFGSVEDASSFFEHGALGYSATSDASRFDGMELQCKTWSVQPLQVEAVHSSYFADHAKFPSGTATFDCALLMRGIEHQWHSREELCCDQRGAVARR